MRNKALTNILAATVLATLFGTASAEDACASKDDAIAYVSAVSAAIEAATFTGKRAYNDQMNMLIKAEAANTKLAVYKLDDSIDKLVDISDKATALTDAAKPKLADATGINDAVGDAVVCINDLI